MGLGYTNRLVRGATATSVSADSFDAAAGSRIYAFVSGVNKTSTALGTPGASGGSLTWNAINSFSNETNGNRCRGTLFYADLASAITGLVVQGSISSAGGVAISLIEVTGFDPAAGFNSGVGTSNSGDPAATLGSSPAASSYVFSWAAAGNTGASITKDGNFTSLHSGTGGWASPGLVRAACAYRLDGTYNNAAWTGPDTRSGSIICEIPVAAAGLVLPRTRMGTRWMTSKRF